MDETLTRTIDELELLLEAGLEVNRDRPGQGSQVSTYQAEDPNQLAAFASKLGICIQEQ